MIQGTSPIFMSIMPKQMLTKAEKKKIEQEELKELIQNPNDPLSKFPLRGLGYSNEVGAAVSAMPVWGKAAETLLWIPALMYLGADIFDKYQKGKEGDYSKASATAAVQQAIFQALASVILPTAAVKMGQSIAGNTAKLGESKLSATAQEELYRKILVAYDKGRFAKSDYIDTNGNLQKGIDQVTKKVLDYGFYDEMKKTRHDLKTEAFPSKIVRFFGHTHRPVVSAKAKPELVDNFMKKKIKDVYDIQIAFENGSDEALQSLGKPKLVKKYKKQFSKIHIQAVDLLKEHPQHMIKKLLNSANPKHENLKKLILQKYNSHLELKALVSSENLSKAMLKEVINAAPENKDIMVNYAKRIETTRKILRSYLKGQEMKFGILKTVGGFIALGCLAVPIDNFVHKYIIKKFIEPGLENVSNFQSKMKLKMK